MAKVKAGISRLNSEGVIGKGQTIVEMMTGNADYPALQAQLAPISDAITELIDANNDAKFVGGKITHQRKRVCDKELRRLINNLAPQVQTASGGDAEKILGGGWDVVKKPEHGEVPDTPVNFRSLLTAYEKTIKLHWRGTKLAIYYRLEMLDDKGNWVIAATTSRVSITIPDLVSGKDYTFRLFAVGAVGTSAATNTVTMKAA